MLGGLDSHDKICRVLASGVPCCVLSIDYRSVYSPLCLLSHILHEECPKCARGRRQAGLVMLALPLGHAAGPCRHPNALLNCGILAAVLHYGT